MWTATDMVCKFACTKEEPDPDFEIRFGIILVQRESVVCGLRNQNTLTDKVITIPLRGKVVGPSLELESGPALQDDEPTFPFKVESRSRLRIEQGVLIEASVGGPEFAKYEPQPFSPAEQRAYVQSNSAFFDACFGQQPSAHP